MGIGRRIYNRLASPLRRMFGASTIDRWFPWGAVSSSGEPVTPERALGLSAYYACIRNISEDLAKLPIKVYERGAEARWAVDDHAVRSLLNVAPNTDSTAIGFRETLFHWALGWGNGYAEIITNGRGDIELWPIHPSQVIVQREARNRFVYVVTEDTGVQRTVVPTNMFHLHGLGNDGITGYSVAQIAVDSIGRAMAAQKFSAAIFAGGCTDRVAIKHPKSLAEAAIIKIRESWMERYGGAGNSQPAVLTEGMEVVRIGIPPEEAQMLETMQFSNEDLSRWFRCPLSKINQFLRAQGWSTLEMLNQDYVTDTLMPWTIRFEQECQRKLLVSGEYVKHCFDALLRGDSSARAAFYRTMREIGILSANEVRRLEDMEPVEGGDTRYIPANWVAAGAIPDTGGEFRRDVARALLAEGSIGDAVADAIVPTENLGATMNENDSAIAEAAFRASATAYDRIVRKEHRACMQALKRLRLNGDMAPFREWSDAFYGRLVSETVATLAPSLRVELRLAGEDDVDDLIIEWCRTHARRSCDAIRDAAEQGVGALEQTINELAGRSYAGIRSNDNADERNTTSVAVG